MNEPRLSPPLAAFLSFVLVALVAAAGGWVTAPAVESWYPTLTLPSFRPPNAAFAPVWTVLYALMAYAAFRIWSAPESPQRRRALIFYGVQLALNAAWSFAFFGARSPLLGLVVILALLAAILMTIRAFLGLDRLAAALLMPYVLWVGFAAVLNAAIYALNA